MSKNCGHKRTTEQYQGLAELSSVCLVAIVKFEVDEEWEETILYSASGYLSCSCSNITAEFLGCFSCIEDMIRCQNMNTKNQGKLPIKFDTKFLS